MQPRMSTVKLLAKGALAASVDLFVFAAMFPVALIVIAATLITADFIFGETGRLPSLISLGVVALIGFYVELIRILWRQCPANLKKVGRVRRLVTFYRECWQRGFALRRVKVNYGLLILAWVAIFTLGPLFYTRIRDVIITASGLLTPTLALTTFLTPLAGLPPHEEISNNQ